MDKFTIVTNAANGLLKIIADFIVGLAWPAVILVLLTRYREGVGKLITALAHKIVGLREARHGGLSLVFEQALEKSAEEARKAVDPVVKATPKELERGDKIAASSTDPWALREAGEMLAVEYETVRASMPSGKDRTRAMSGAVAKMRTLNKVMFPLRYEYVNSPSPGRRLLVIAALSVTPDHDLIEWLTERVLTERPFVAFHAMVALLTAIHSKELATPHVAALTRAVETIAANRAKFTNDSDRAKLLLQLEQSVRELPVGARQPTG